MRRQIKVAFFIFVVFDFSESKRSMGNSATSFCFAEQLLFAIEFRSTLEEMKGLYSKSSSPYLSAQNVDKDEELAKNSNSLDQNAVRRIVHSSSMKSGATEEELFLSITPPVKGFEIIPSFICRQKNGEVIPDPMSRYRFTWYRSRKYFLCNGDNCINGGKQNGDEMKCQCLTCLQYGNERYSYFCCPECMQKNWCYHVKYVI